MGDAPRFQAEEEHHYAANDCDDADPVDGFDAGEERCAWSVDVEEEKEHGKSEAIKGKVYVELFID